LNTNTAVNANKNIEIERKFLVNGRKFAHAMLLGMLAGNEGISIRQAYVFDTDKGVLRVREKGEKYYLTIKDRPSKLLSKIEIEFEIEKEQAMALFSMSDPDKNITKTRYEIEHKGKLWEVDVFGGKLEEFMLAEIELQSEDEEFELPKWVDIEVTEDAMFQNSNLINVNKHVLFDHIEAIRANK